MKMPNRGLEWSAEPVLLFGSRGASRPGAP